MIPEPAFIRPAGSNPGSFLGFYLQAEILEQEMIQKIAEDPEGAAKAWIGRAHLQKFGWLLGSVEDAERAAGIRLFFRDDQDRPLLFISGNTFAEVVWDYPLRFKLADILLEAKYITAQLVAMEYLEGAGELTPYTPEAILDRPMGEDQEQLHKNRPLQDPFETESRPDCTVEAIEPGGKTETFNLNPELPARPKPEGGFVNA